jgi:hypothetical protein
MKSKIFLLLFLYGCSSPSGPPELTPITTSGANTISFLINGNVFLPSSAENGFNLAPPAYSIDVAHPTWDTGYWTSQIMLNTSSQTDVFEIVFYKLLDTGTFPLATLPEDGGWAGFALNGLGSNSGGFVTSDSLSAWIHISRFDTNANIISGTFAMTMVGVPITDSIIQITDGRFDFHYTP